MSSWHGGKGSKQRKTDANKFSDNYDAIFGKKKNQEEQLEHFDDIENKSEKHKAEPWDQLP